MNAAAIKLDSCFDMLDKHEQRALNNIAFILNSVRLDIDSTLPAMVFEERVNTAWLNLTEEVYLSWGDTQEDNFDADGGIADVLPREAFRDEETYLYFTFANVFNYPQGVDPRKTRQVTFDGPLINFHLSWALKFATWFNLGQSFVKVIDEYQDLVSTFYKFEFEHTSYQVMLQYR